MSNDLENRPVTSNSSVSRVSFKEVVEKAGAPLTAAGLIVSFISGAIAKWTSLTELFAARPLEVVGVGFFLCSGVTWFSIGALASATLPTRLVTALRAGTVVLLAALSVALLISEPTCFFGCGKALWMPIKIGGPVSSALAAETQGLKVLDVVVDESRSTFRITNDDQGIDGGRDDKIRIGVEFDRSMYEVFESASCRGMNGEQPIEDALPVWRSLLEKRSRTDLVRKLADYNGYKDLIQRGGADAFNAARPNQAEIVELNRDKLEWYELVMRWMVECVGVADPVIIWTLENDTSKTLTLSSVDYNVLKVSQVKGAGPETVEPIDVAPHDLAHTKGVQSRPIVPRIKIPPGEQAAFRVKYRMESTEPGFTWLVQPTFRTLEGISAVGPELKILNAKGR